jgi:hypothetical protein
MMRKTFLILSLSALAFLAACSGGSTTDETKTITEDKIDSGVPADAKIQMKSGIVTYEVTAMLMKQELTMYFDDYGKKRRSEMKINVLGKEMMNYTLVDSAYTHSWDPESKMGSRYPNDAKSPENINFNALTDEVKKEFNIKEEGTEVVLGKNCKVFSIDYKNGELKGKYSVWHGITLKAEATAKGSGIEMIATKLEENVPIAADKFKLPSGINWAELKSADEMMPK